MPSTILAAAFSFAVGLAFGSFFNVLVYRIPRGESVVWPGSRCPDCKRPIKARENLPLVSYVFLGGKCAGCGGKISAQYPLVEFLTGILSVLLWFSVVRPFLQTQHPWYAFVALAVQIIALLILVPVAIIDILHYIIPDRLSLGGLALGIAASFLPGGITPPQAGLGILAGGGSLFAVGLIGEKLLRKEEAMGGGDIKLMAFIGAIFGWKTALLSIVLGSLFGSIIGLGMMATGVLGKERRIPFGPFLAAGVWISALYGNQLLSAYMRFIERLLFA